jgi:hypothetical protein
MKKRPVGELREVSHVTCGRIDGRETESRISRLSQAPRMMILSPGPTSMISRPRTGTRLSTYTQGECWCRCRKTTSKEAWHLVSSVQPQTFFLLSFPPLLHADKRTKTSYCITGCSDIVCSLRVKWLEQLIHKSHIKYLPT